MKKMFERPTSHCRLPKKKSAAHDDDGDDRKSPAAAATPKTESVTIRTTLPKMRRMTKRNDDGDGDRKRDNGNNRGMASRWILSTILLQIPERGRMVVLVAV